MCDLNHSGVTGVCLIRQVERESCECASVRALVLQVRYDLCGEEALCSRTRFVWRLVSGVDTLGRLGRRKLIGDVSF